MKYFISKMNEVKFNLEHNIAKHNIANIANIETLNSDLNNVASWLSANKLTLNNSKTEYMIIGSNKRLSRLTSDPAINVGNFEIKRVKTTKSLAWIDLG